MIYDSYSIKTMRTVNCMDLAKESPMSFTYKGMDLPTKDPEIFDSYSPGYLREIFDIQKKEMMKLLSIQMTYQCVSKIEYERTIEQYKDLYFYKEDEVYYAFEKSRILEKVVRDDAKNRTMVSRPVQKELLSDSAQQKVSASVALKRPQYKSEDDVTDSDLDDTNDPRTKSLAGSPVINFLPDGAIGVSVQGIRDITGYSYRIKMPWNTDYVTIQWQKYMMDDQSNILVVDGSRQGGKSKGIAEKTLEESYVPGADMMVAAFMQETTESIWDYMLDYIENFDEDEFEIKERKRYIQNNRTGVRIHFRTLMNGAKGIRGKTLRYIVIDEAMLISNDIIESIILPTQTTILNPRLILLGTAAEDTSCYMYRCIMDIEKGKTYNNEGQYTARYIKFSILDNPIASPMKVRYVMDHKNDPKIQREYFNKWGKLEDSLFQIRPVPFVSIETNSNAWLILSSDPARKEDRSGWSLIQCMNGKLTFLESGEVPAEWKGSWNMQGKYFLKLRERYKAYPNFIMTGDKTGVGDGVFEIFAGLGLPVKYLCHYVAGDTVSKQSDDTEKIQVYTVGKSVLINNFVDLSGEGKLIIPEESNELLIGETERIQAAVTRTGKLTFKTPYYDDVTNSGLVGCFFAKHRGYIDRIVGVQKSEPSFKKELSIYSKPKKTPSRIF